LPTTEQARDGGIIAAMNARYLLDAAVVLADKDFCGPAVSLAVLAFEEATKGRALLGLVAVARNPGSRYGFTDAQLRTLIYGPQHGLRHAAGLSQHLSPVSRTALATGTTPRGAEDKAALDADLAAGEWLQRANHLKQAGLYVNFHDDHWHNPRELKQQDWDLARGIVGPFVDEAVRQAIGNLANKQAGKL
jgi:AbiV family abortive infection protein